MQDPRRSSRYRTTRTAWLAGYAGQPGTCCLCGGTVRTDLPGTHRLGPTIEHHYPVRHIMATAQDWAQAVAMACDTSQWGLAHRVCQDRQGQAVTSATNRTRNAARGVDGASRVW